MAVVHLSNELAGLAGGADVVRSDAPRVDALKADLMARYPALTGALDGLAVAIDGEILADADYAPLHADAQVHFVPLIVGG